MNNEVVVHPQVRVWLERSVLQPYVSELCLSLQRDRYAESTKRSYLHCIAHFAHWTTSRRINLAQLSERLFERFVVAHLPHCDCPYPARRSRHEISAALAYLLRTLRASSAITERGYSQTPLQAELADFDHYMEQVGGLAPNTRKQRVCIVRRFLTELFGRGSIVLTSTRPANVRAFVLGAPATYSTGTIHVIAGAIRYYFRFRSVSGDRVQRLVDAVPSVAHWRLAALPDFLSEREIQQLLDSFGQLSSSGKRAYAMVRCLTDLGLRASEVVQLHLDDIDWRASTIRLAANKSRRVDVLPLPSEMGRAIAEYLRTERPQTTNRSLFVRHVAPLDKPIKAGVVRTAVKQAYRRCGWPHTRVHILRHSLASRLLQAGTPLKEIADILRHRSLDTSVIYTKVDQNRLSAVALPWPGRSL
jgi:site-specific recombinase XerD